MPLGKGLRFLKSGEPRIERAHAWREEVEMIVARRVVAFENLAIVRPVGVTRFQGEHFEEVLAADQSPLMEKFRQTEVTDDTGLQKPSQHGKGCRGGAVESLSVEPFGECENRATRRCRRLGRGIRFHMHTLETGLLAQG